MKSKHKEQPMCGAERGGASGEEAIASGYGRSDFQIAFVVFNEYLHISHKELTKVKPKQLRTK